MTIGYAVVTKSADIDLRTVGDTERMAKVNGICVLGGTMPKQSWTDADIDRFWRKIQVKTGAKIERVNITFAD